MSSPLKFVDPVSAIAGAVGGLGQIATGIFGSRRRKREARAAQGEFNAARQGILDTTFTNQFSGLDNPFEDMQVNLQASQFQAQQTQQSQANILNTLQAGGGFNAIGNNYHCIMRRINKDMYTYEDSKTKQVAMILKIMNDCNFKYDNVDFSEIAKAKRK